MMHKFISSILIGILAVSCVASCEKSKTTAGEAQNDSAKREGLTYTVDTTVSKIEWKGYKILKSESLSHFGTINFEEGNVTVRGGKLESGKFEARMKSLQNIDLEGDAEQKAKLESHLKSADFFETEKFPIATYEITQVIPNVDSGDYNTILDGRLTLKGITKPVQFHANVSVAGSSISIATEPKDISRRDFGIEFQMPAADGLIKDEINLQILIKAVAKK